MKLQELKFSCGPSALRAALYSLSHRISERAIRNISGTNAEGTDEFGLLKALKHYGHNAKEYEFHNRKEAWEWLKHTMSSGNPVIICSDNWNHWMTALGLLGKKIWIFDPEDYTTKKRRSRYSGLGLYSEKRLMKRWKKNEGSPRKNIYYAIYIVS